LLTVSEYLRNLGLGSKIDRRQKVLPKEVLAFTGTMNHIAANLNQIAKKRNGIEVQKPVKLTYPSRSKLTHLFAGEEPYFIKGCKQ